MRIRRRLARAAEALGVCLLRRFITVLLVVGRQHLTLYRVVTGRLRTQRHARRRARDGVAGDAGGGEGCGQHHTRQQQQPCVKGQQPRVIAPPPPPASMLQAAPKFTKPIRCSNFIRSCWRRTKRRKFWTSGRASLTRRRGRRPRRARQRSAHARASCSCFFRYALQTSACHDGSR